LDAFSSSIALANIEDLSISDRAEIDPRDAANR
jgi:hypothetical protein